MKIPILTLILAALILSACVGIPTPTPAPTTLIVNASTTPAPRPSASVKPIAVPSISIPSPIAPVLPAVTTAPIANASAVPSLSEVSLRLAPIVNGVFNISRTTKNKDLAFKEIDANVLSMGDDEPSYVYTLTLSNAKTHWLPEEILQTAVSPSGIKNGFSSYTVGSFDTANVMKCFGQRYEINLNLKGYNHNYFSEDYQPLMRRIMGQLVEACPP